MGPCKVLLLWVKVNLRIIATNGYSRTKASLSGYWLWSLIPLQRRSRCILQPQSTGLADIKYAVRIERKNLGLLDEVARHFCLDAAHGICKNDHQ